MASKLLTTETSSEGPDVGPDVGPETRDAVIANIKSALQAYLGTNTTITLIAVSDDEYSEGRDLTQDYNHGIMTVANNTNVRVTPDIAGTNLVYHNTSTYIYARLFLCTDTNSTDTRFLFVWHVREPVGWQWYTGAPYLSVGMRTSPAVPFSRENITRQARSGLVPPIEAALATMIPEQPGQMATQFNNSIFAWTRGSNDDNFQVSKATASGAQLYWRAQETTPAVILTADVPRSGRFKFRQT